MGHPKRLLLVSEPKIQSHHEKGKVGHPCSLCFTPGFGFPRPGIYWKRREGNLRAPSSPQQPRKEESTREENGAWPLWPRTRRGALGIWTVKLPAAHPGVFTSLPGQGVRYRARDQLDTELSVLGWLHPQLALLGIILLHPHTGACSFPASKPSGLHLP